MTTERVQIEVTDTGTRVVARNISDIGDKSAQSARSVDLLKNALKTAFTGLYIQQLIQTVDTYTTLINRLKLVTSSTANLVEINNRLFDIAGKTRSSYESTVVLYSRLATATEKYKISQERLLGITQAVNLAAAISGTAAANQAAGITQLAQAIGSGVLRGDELTSILENVPRVAKVIADGLGVSVSDLKVLGEQGKIAASDIIKAFEKAAPVLREEFAKTTPTISQGFLVLKDNIMKALGELDQGAGLSAAFAQGLLGAASSADIMIKSILALATVLAVQYAVQGVGAALTATKALTAAMLANPFGALLKAILVVGTALAVFSLDIKASSDSVATLRDIVVVSFREISDVVAPVLSTIGSLVGEIAPSLSGIIGSADISVRGFLRAIATGIDAAVGMFKGLSSSIPSAMGSVGPALELIFVNVFNSILRSAAAWYNALLNITNEITSRVGLGVGKQVEAFQLPLSSKAQSLGETISKSIAVGIESEDSAKKAIESLLAKAEIEAKARLKDAGKSTITDHLTDALGSGVTGKGTAKETEASRFIKQLQEEEVQLGKTKIEMALLKAEELGVLQQATPLIDSIQKKTAALEAQEKATQELAKDQQLITRLTNELLTPLERYNKTVEELNRLRSVKGDVTLGTDTYNRALKQAQEELTKTGASGKSVFGDLDQYAVQGARNMQSAFANFLFDPFNDGVDNLFNNFVSVLKRMAAEIVSAKLLQGFGIDKLFGGSGTVASGASGQGGGILGTLSSAFGFGGLKSTGSTILTKLGFGSSAARAGVFGPGGLPFLGGAGTAVGASEFGTLGAATAGLSSVAPFAIAGIVIDGLARKLAGNKTLGNGFTDFMQKIPILGAGWNIVAGLFGRGPLKQRATTLDATIGDNGVTGGQLVTDFVAKGGLFRSNKNDFAKVELLTGKISTDNSKLNAFAKDLGKYAGDLVKTINDTVKGFSNSAKDAAQKLGADVSSIENYTKVIQLKSEKGKAITEEAIKELLTGIGEEMAGGILAQLNYVVKVGETNIEALSRLADEFDVLKVAAISTGRSVAEASVAINTLTFEQRSAIVEQLGGVKSANDKVNLFIDNFLGASELLPSAFTTLDAEMRKLGFSANITKQQFKDLVQSAGKAGGITLEQYTGLLNLTSKFIEFDKLRADVLITNTNLVSSEETILGIRTKLAAAYQKESAGLLAMKDRFSSLVKTLQDFSDGLNFSNLSPLTPAQQLDEARTQFNRTRSLAASGDADALAKLPEVASQFLKASQVYNASGAAYVSDFQLVQDTLKTATETAKNQVTETQRQIDLLDSSVSNLIDIEKNTGTTNELLQQLISKTLSGPGNPTISTSDIKTYLNDHPNLSPGEVANIAAQYGVSNNQLQAAGYDVSQINRGFSGSTVTDQQIKDFLAGNPAPMQIYDALKANGIGFERFSKVSGIKMNELEQWARMNNVPVLNVGTDYVSRSGIGFLHKGETIGPSTMPGEMSKLREELRLLREEQAAQTKNIVRVTAVTNQRNADDINRENRIVARRIAYERNNVARRR